MLYSVQIWHSCHWFCKLHTLRYLHTSRCCSLYADDDFVALIARRLDYLRFLKKIFFSCLYYSKVLRTSSASQWFEWIAMGMESEQDGKVLATWITLNHSIEDTVISYRCLARGISSSYKKSCWRLLGDRDQRKNNNLKRDASEDRYPQNQWPWPILLMSGFDRCFETISLL